MLVVEQHKAKASFWASKLPGSSDVSEDLIQRSDLAGEQREAFGCQTEKVARYFPITGTIENSLGAIPAGLVIPLAATEAGAHIETLFAPLRLDCHEARRILHRKIKLRGVGFFVEVGAGQ